ncbi:zf-HC2 domain-containing protein [Nonomuraea sp. NPDC050547]|uniref:Anti-sigma factor RsiW n=1 Tax=Nonomuraea endophytica TaxID=714136 RepID=A0A7W7ZVS6_9ACTN|nr:zf-HC2 domain-containing protein [Nonomuraea endophytica]MBB5074685.1 anti-sigma factor RsiW [Nonomuraea endophytica]
MHHEVAAYVLGVLDEEEHEAFERHLDACQDCQVQLRELSEVPELLDELKHSPTASEDSH